MELRVPTGSWFDHLLADPHLGAAQGTTGAPTAGDLDAAIEAMRRGHVEFVLLDAGDGTFVQAAGAGESGYLFERWQGGAAVDRRDGVPLEVVRAELHRYLAGAPAAVPDPPAVDRTRAEPAAPRRRWWSRRA